jgi:hypothetical protein
MLAKDSREKPQSEQAIRLIAACIVIGFFGSILYASQALSLAQVVSVIGVAVVIAGAALLTGSLLGFLFGIPRTLQQETTVAASQNQSKDIAKQDSPQGISYQVNTNLEQISDWLTKILVGVGLTQISALPEALQNYATYTSAGLGNFPSSQVFAVALLVYFLICGFLISYLWTRLYLAGAFRQADVAAIGGKLAEVESKINDLERQAEIDAKALGIFQRQLNPAADTPPIPQDEINARIRSASSSVKVQIFSQAQSVRSENWRDRQNKPKMERTIPIFRALVASDTDDVYHTNHGQLAFALKDQRQPNWAEAVSELTKAIEIRGPWQEHGWLLYEFNRAICQINLDEAFKQGQESDNKTKQLILSDLKAAGNAAALADLIADDPTISQWLELNGTTGSKATSRRK